MSADVLRERWKGDDERKARVLRLIVRGTPAVAQGQIEAAAAEELLGMVGLVKLPAEREDEQ